MPKIDIKKAPERRGSGYPAPFHETAGARVKKVLGDAGGLTQFGVNLTELPPGCWSSQRHWHTAEDELVYVLSGEVTLVTDDGEEVLRAGDAAAFPHNSPNGHHLINKSDANATYLEIGTRSEFDTCYYPDIDMMTDAASGHYVHRAKPYPKRER